MANRPDDLAQISNGFIFIISSDSMEEEEAQAEEKGGKNRKGSRVELDEPHIYNEGGPQHYEI